MLGAFVQLLLPRGQPGGSFLLRRRTSGERRGDRRLGSWSGLLGQLRSGLRLGNKFRRWSGSRRHGRLRLNGCRRLAGWSCAGFDDRWIGNRNGFFDGVGGDCLGRGFRLGDRGGFDALNLLRNGLDHRFGFVRLHSLRHSFDGFRLGNRNDFSNFPWLRNRLILCFGHKRLGSFRLCFRCGFNAFNWLLNRLAHGFGLRRLRSFRLSFGDPRLSFDSFRSFRLRHRDGLSNFLWLRNRLIRGFWFRSFS